jgi:hypothetical protein
MQAERDSGQHGALHALATNNAEVLFQATLRPAILGAVLAAVALGLHRLIRRRPDGK